MTDVIMPQMGESIAEGTVTKWLKKVGDRVERDEPLFEISTDKVDAEIPAPAAGILKEIRVEPGTTVPINTVVAILATARKTGRVLVLHEATYTGGPGGEVAALVAERAFEHLDAPVVRMAPPDTPVPYSPPLEDAFLPDAARVLEAIRALAAY